MANRVGGSLTVDKQTNAADEIRSGFMSVGYSCCAWIIIQDHQYAVRFDSRQEQADILRDVTRMVGYGGFTWFLAALMTKEIRMGLLRT